MTNSTNSPFDGFSKREQVALFEEMKTTPIDRFHTLDEDHWKKHTDCWNLNCDTYRLWTRFRNKLHDRGWAIWPIWRSRNIQIPGLSRRAVNVLEREQSFDGLLTDKKKTKKQLKKLLLSRWKTKSLNDPKWEPRNMGIKTYNEMCRFVGLPEIRKHRKWKFCPLTGKPLDPYTGMPIK